MKTSPAQTRAATFADLIGPAKIIGKVLLAKLERLNPQTDTVAMLFHGPPGVGKSELASLFADTLIGGKSCRTYAREKISGAKINADLVRRWHDARGVGSLFSDWTVKIIEEVDAMPTVAQTLMLDYLDEAAPGTAILATSNEQIKLLEERFRRRFQVWHVTAPTTEEIAAFLKGKFPDIYPAEALTIATLCNGCVGAALHDAENAIDIRFFESLSKAA